MSCCAVVFLGIECVPGIGNLSVLYRLHIEQTGSVCTFSCLVFSIKNFSSFSLRVQHFVLVKARIRV